MIDKMSLLILVSMFSCSTQSHESKVETTQKMGARTDKPIAPSPSVDTNSLAFRSLNFFAGKVEVSVPEQLQPMDKKMFGLKYPEENQATTIAYSDADATVNLLISPRSNKATQVDLPEYEQMLTNSLRSNPSIDFLKSEVQKINGRDFIVIEIITPAMDTEVYNLMFATSLDDKLLMSTFNCTIEKMQEWQPLAKQILASVKVQD